LLAYLFIYYNLNKNCSLLEIFNHKFMDLPQLRAVCRTCSSGVRLSPFAFLFRSFPIDVPTL